MKAYAETIRDTTVVHGKTMDAVKKVAAIHIKLSKPNFEASAKLVGQDHEAAHKLGD